jgi:hypothetical protein
MFSILIFSHTFPFCFSVFFLLSFHFFLFFFCFSLQVKIIPTQFTSSNGYITKSNQYSFTQKFVPVGEGEPEDIIRPASEGGDKNVQPHLARGHLHRHASIIRALPGVFFIYDMSPFMIMRTEESVGLPHFLVRVCAVIGGVFTTSAMISRFFSFLVTGGKMRDGDSGGVGDLFK